MEELRLPVPRWLSLVDASCSRQHPPRKRKGRNKCPAGSRVQTPPEAPTLKGPCRCLDEPAQPRTLRRVIPRQIYSKYFQDRGGQIEAVTVHLTSGLKSTIIHG